jgi:hypothetical protein
VKNEENIFLILNCNFKYVCEKGGRYRVKEGVFIDEGKAI